jgi:glycosyltransferase involved in cell wall biosynthesis
MHIVVALAGLHRVRRGAEVVLESVAQHIAARGEHQVTLLGSGAAIEGRAYRFEHVPAIPRERFERWPKLPFLRNEFMYEDATFAAGLLRHSALRAADVTLTCGYPYTSWALRRARGHGRRAPHVFVTQNGDWPATHTRKEARFFACDGLICTNPVFFERNQARWRCALIPNGIDPGRFKPGPTKRQQLGLPVGRKIVLMVSALQPGKRIPEAIRAVAKNDDAFLVIAGDGSLRDEVDALAAKLLPGRFATRTFPHEMMPDVYRSADLFLHTTIGESFGNVYVEALACGLPVVAHDEATTRWILQDNGILVDTTSEEILARAIGEGLRASKADPQKAVAFAHENFGWQKIADQYLQFLASVAGGNRSG